MYCFTKPAIPCCCQIKLSGILGWLLAAFIISSCRPQENTGSQMPEDVLSTFEVAEGFTIELIASEPLIADPVAMEIDEYGRMYVVEMHGYPLDKSGTGKVKLLTDTDGDGKMDKSTTFADQLVLPTGIMRWKKGVLVTDPPNVLYLEDSNGDGKADVQTRVLTGFALSNPQHNVNNPLLGIDNWIYLGHESAVTAKVYKEEFGDRGKEIFYPEKPSGPRLPVNGNGRSIRFRPDSYQLEMTSSHTQFGHSFDQWGNRLLVTNYNHIYQEVLAAPYLKRNPDLLVSSTTQSLSDHGNAADVFPITKNPEHQLLTDVGVVTSACGIIAYSGGMFPAPYEQVSFVAEPVSNLIHADRLQHKGASFTASRLFPQKEFLASTDAWFRPVNMYIGPDGALYVVDYYRQYIEHPEWMAEEVVKSGALYNGTDKGRIYRITATGSTPLQWTKDSLLAKASDEQLVKHLAHANIWWRRHAQRLLLDRMPHTAVPLLQKMVQNSSSAMGRLHALWTLEGMGKLTPEILIHSLKDPEAGIRQNAIKLAELHLANSPSLVQSLLSMQTDTDAKVRYQLLCTLGFLSTPEAALVRQKLLVKDMEDEWVQIAALSAPASHKSGLLEAILKEYKPDSPSHAALIKRLGAISAASGEGAAIHQLIQQGTASAAGAPPKAWQAPLLEGLAQGLAHKTVSSETLPAAKAMLVKACFDHPSLLVRESAVQLLKVLGLPENAQIRTALNHSRKIAGNRNKPAGERAQAIHFLALSKPAQDTSFLETLLVPGEPLPVQVAALEALSAIPGQAVSRYVLQHWTSLTPEIREPALNTFMSDSVRISLLLEAIERGQIHQASVGWPRSVRLMSHANEQLRKRARVLLTRKDSERQQVIRQYQAALNLTADPIRGKAVFQQHCMSCHQMGGVGVAFGPDLSSLKNRAPASIMADILDPNQSIADGYDLWTVEIKNGKTLQGILASETPTALTLRTTGGQETAVSRQEIEELRAVGMSAMPAGLEKQLNQQQMADVVAYIKQIK